MLNPLPPASRRAAVALAALLGAAPAIAAALDSTAVAIDRAALPLALISR